MAPNQSRSEPPVISLPSSTHRDQPPIPDRQLAHRKLIDDDLLSSETVVACSEVLGEALAGVEGAAAVQGETVDGAAQIVGELLGEPGAGAPAKVALRVD